MTTIKEIKSKTIEFSSNDKNELSNKNIIFIDFSPKDNLLLLLTSLNSLYLYEINKDKMQFKKKFEAITEKTTKIKKCYFCNENSNIILLLCDNFHIFEFTIDREYISHIYYDVLGDIYDFKMNCQKKTDSTENIIQNFCVYKNNEINVWNTLKYNKKNVLNAKNINCFSYDFTGLILYYVGKLNQKNYIKTVKFIDENECKEIYDKTLTCLDSKVSIDFLNSYDVNLIMSDTKLGRLFILKNYPINKVYFEIPLNNYQLYLPFMGNDPLFQFGILCLRINESEQKVINLFYKQTAFNAKNVKLKLHNLYYFKESTTEKGTLLTFDDLKKEIKVYNILD